MSSISKKVMYKDHQITLTSDRTGLLEVALHQVQTKAGEETRRTCRLHSCHEDDVEPGIVSTEARASALLSDCADWLDRKLEKEAKASAERQATCTGMEKAIEVFDAVSRRNSE